MNVMKIKSLFMTIGILLVSDFAMQAMTVNQFIDKLDRQEGVSRISLSPFVMKICSLFEDTKGVNSVKLLNLENCSPAMREQFIDDLRSLKDSDFDTVVSSNEGGEYSKILMKVEDGVIKEIVVCNIDGEIAVIQVKGKIKPENMDEVIEDNDGRR